MESSSGTPLGLPLDSAGYVICLAKSEWQIKFACQPPLTLFHQNIIMSPL